MCVVVLIVQWYISILVFLFWFWFTNFTILLLIYSAFLFCARWFGLSSTFYVSLSVVLQIDWSRRCEVLLFLSQFLFLKCIIILFKFQWCIYQSSCSWFVYIVFSMLATNIYDNLKCCCAQKQLTVCKYFS